MKRLKFVLASIVLAVLSRGAFAAVTNTWVGANTADGAADRTSLSDGANWSLGHVPESGEVALMMMVNKNVNNTLDLGASDAAFAPSALVWRADDYTAGGQKLYIDRSLTLDCLEVGTYGAVSGGGGTLFEQRVVVGSKTEDPVSLTLAGNDNPLRLLERNGIWGLINVSSNVTVNFTGNDIHFSAPVIKRLFTSPYTACFWCDKDKGQMKAGSNATVNFTTPGATITIENQKWRGVGLGTGAANLRVRSDQTWHCDSSSFAWIIMRQAIDSDHRAGTVIESIDGGRLDNLGELNLRLDRYAAVHDAGKGMELVGGTYGSLYFYGGNTTLRNAYIELSGDVRLKSRCVELSTDAADESQWAHPIPYGLVLRTTERGMSHYNIVLGGHKLETDYGVLIRDTSSDDGANKIIDARGSELVISGDFEILSDGASATAGSPKTNCGIRADNDTTLSLGGSFRTNMKAYNGGNNATELSDATVNLIGGTDEIKTIEVGDAESATAAASPRGTFIVGTLNVGTNDAPSDARLVNEYLNNNPKAEGEDVDPADGRIGEKLIVKNLYVATGSTLRVNGQNVEVGASLSVADGGVIDLDDGETLSVGKPFANFYGDGDQLVSWSVAAKNVTDLACRGSAFRAVYDSQSNRTYFVCKSTGAGLVVLIR